MIDWLNYGPGLAFTRISSRRFSSCEVEKNRNLHTPLRVFFIHIFTVISFYFFSIFSFQPESQFHSTSASSRTSDAIMLPPSSLDIMVLEFLNFHIEFTDECFETKLFP